MRWIGLAAGGLGRWAAVPGTRTMARAGLSPAGAVCGGAFTARATAVSLLMASPCAHSRATAGSLRWRAEAR